MALFLLVTPIYWELAGYPALLGPLPPVRPSLSPSSPPPSFHPRITRLRPEYLCNRSGYPLNVMGLRNAFNDVWKTETRHTSASSLSQKPLLTRVFHVLWRHRTSSMRDIKNYRQHYVISRHVGGLLGDVSWQPFLFLESPWDGSIFLGESQSHIFPNVCQIWLRSDGRVEKRGVQRDRQSKGHYTFI